ncbi:hypothetical protein Q5692_13445 [Microcoleus sp. C2C3]|uniref:hypothetical protein n=1 Tax=unclassified Microcoleus TaxID=2642155 RepID=UPI002FD4070E
MGGRFIFCTCTGPLAGNTEIRSHFDAKRKFDRTLTHGGISIALCRAEFRSHFDMVSGWMGTIESRSIIPHSPTPDSRLPTPHHSTSPDSRLPTPDSRLPIIRSATGIDMTQGGNSIAQFRFEGTDRPNHKSIAHSTF